MKTILLSILVLCFSLVSRQLAAENLLTDRNGDGVVTVVAFGDSISYGLGDLEQPGEFVELPRLPNATFGYLRRVRAAGLNTINRSVPGEFFTTDGIARFSAVAGASGADVIGIMEGTNDAGLQVSPREYRRNLQKAINIAKAHGVEPVLFTVLPTCCFREGRTLFTDEYSKMVRQLANVNGVAIADITRAWNNTCNVITPAGEQEHCPLFNIPDGLHPNNMGHDLIAHTFLATVYDVNVFAPSGAADLESAAGLSKDSVFIEPDQFTVSAVSDEELQ